VATLRNLRLGSWQMIAACAPIAAMAWGLYAWRHSAAQPDAGKRDQTVVREEGGAREADQARAVLLRAERPAAAGADESGVAGQSRATAPYAPAPSAEADTALTSAVRANKPPSATEVIEMTLRPAKPKSAGDVSVRRRTLGQARSALAGGDLIAARAIMSAGVVGGLSPTEEAEARAELSRLADVLLFSRASNTNDPLTGTCTVAAGDTLYEIARRHRVTERLLMRVNGIIEPNRLHVGQRLKVVHGPFRGVISKSHHRMDVFLADVLVRSFRVGLGTNGGTPTGSWVVNSKLENPDWTNPETGRYYLADDPENPIGERWLGLEGRTGDAAGRAGFGIHGTIDPASIGEDSSMGCIRLAPADAEMVYDLLVIGQSEVRVEG